MKFLVFVAGAFFPTILQAQSAPAGVAAGASVTGAVFDSVARAPLGGAVVQIVAADNPSRFEKSVAADSTGRFALSGVPDGSYALGFFHPMLDSLGVEAPLKKVTVSGSRSLRVDLAIPSPQRLKAAICNRPVNDSSGAVIGIVRDARNGSPAAGVSVWGEWLELAIRNRSLAQSVQRVRATTGDNGWFALCGVPGAGTVALLASRPGDSTGFIEIHVPPEKFVRRDLYVGGVEGRVSGTVVSVAGVPVAGAQVSITDGPQARTNERGEWTIAGVRGGTRMLEVRALGFYPDRRKVDVVEGAQPVHVRLSTLKAVLDTVKIVASRLSDTNGFEQRRRSAMGSFITPQDMKRFPVIETTDFFMRLPGIRRDGPREQIVMRGAFGWCSPAVFINGYEMSFMTAEDIDDWVRPHEVAGIEIYREGTAPPQFHPGLRGCGSIVLWTK